MFHIIDRVRRNKEVTIYKFDTYDEAAIEYKRMMDTTVDILGRTTNKYVCLYIKFIGEELNHYVTCQTPMTTTSNIGFYPGAHYAKP